MADIETIKRLLAEEYGIKSDRELSEAIGKSKINIGVCVSPVRKESEKHGKDRCIA